MDIQPRRVLQERVLEPLSERIIAGEIGEGATVRIDFATGRFEITVAGVR